MNPDVQWSTKEKLAIASYVCHVGDQHWTGSVSRILRPLGDPDRPADWFSPKNCAQQYTSLVEAAETTRRKRPERSDSNDSISSTLQVPAPSINEIILRKVTQERIEELKKLIRNEKATYRKILQTVEQLESGELDDKVDEMYEDMQKQKQAQELSDSRLSESTTTTLKSDENCVTDAEISKVSLPSDSSVSIPSDVTKQLDEDPVHEGEIMEFDKGVTNDNLLILSTQESEPSTDMDQLQTSSLEKVESVAPATPPSQIQQTSTSAEAISDEEMEAIPTVPTDAIPQTVTVATNEASPSQTSEKESSIIEVPIETMTDETLVPPKSSEQQAEISQNLVTLERAVDDVGDSFTQSTLGIEKLESTIENDVADSETPLIANATITDSCTLNNPEADIETKNNNSSQELAPFEEDTQDLISSQERTAIETPDVSVIEGNVPSLQKTEDDEKTEEESVDYESNISSTPYIESFPNSPALSTTSDVDPEVTAQSRAWKKSIMILWKQVASHRYASLFLHPVTNEIAPNYSSIVLRPMDLCTLKRNVENGLVRTTGEFQRDLMLMFQNALMYNNCEHDVYKMAQEMQNDVMDQVEQFLATQLMMETTKQQIKSKGLRRSTLRKSTVVEKTSKRVADSEAKLTKN